VGHCTSNVVNEFYSVACFSEFGLIWDLWRSVFDHSRDTFLGCNELSLYIVGLWTLNLVSFPDVIKDCLQVGPTQCTYLYSQAVLIQSSYIATCFSGSQHHHQGRQLHRPTHNAIRRCLYSHAHTPILWVPLQHQACLFYTYWEVWHKQAVCWRRMQHIAAVHDKIDASPPPPPPIIPDDGGSHHQNTYKCVHSVEPTCRHAWYKQHCEICD